MQNKSKSRPAGRGRLQLIKEEAELPIYTRWKHISKEHSLRTCFGICPVHHRQPPELPDANTGFVIQHKNERALCNLCPHVRAYDILAAPKVWSFTLANPYYFAFTNISQQSWLKASS